MLRLARYVLVCCGGSADETADMQADQDHRKQDDSDMSAEDGKEKPGLPDVNPIEHGIPCNLAEDLEANTRRKRFYKRIKGNKLSIDKKAHRAKLVLEYPQEFTTPEADCTTLQQSDSKFNKQEEIPVKEANPVPLKGILKIRTVAASFVPVLRPRFIGRKRRNS
jgi:hypothetical protein